MFNTFKFNHLAVASMAAAVLISAPLSAMAIGSGIPSNAVHFSSPTPAATIDFISRAGFGLDANCLACVTATSSLSGSLSGYIGTYNLGISAFGGGPVDQATPIAPGSSIYSQQFSFGGGGGFFSMTSGVDTLLYGKFNKFSIYAKPGSNSATFQFDLYNLSSNEISPLPANLYFIVTGTTTYPVSTSTISIPVPPYSLTDFNTIGIDWTGKVSTTPYSVSSVPEPGEWALLMSGLGLMGFVATRRSKSA